MAQYDKGVRGLMFDISHRPEEHDPRVLEEDWGGCKMLEEG